jgi:hypothetical protein
VSRVEGQVWRNRRPSDFIEKATHGDCGQHMCSMRSHATTVQQPSPRPDYYQDSGNSICNTESGSTCDGERGAKGPADGNRDCGDLSDNQRHTGTWTTLGYPDAHSQRQCRNTGRYLDEYPRNAA